MINAIKKIAKAYGEAYNRYEFNDKAGNKPAHRELYLNDMSLVFGGRFDHKQTLQPPHREHMFGEEVDIQMNEMNSKQIAWFKLNGDRKHKKIVGGKEVEEYVYGFIRRPTEPDENPTHFHCSVVRETELKN